MIKKILPLAIISTTALLASCDDSVTIKKISLDVNDSTAGTYIYAFNTDDMKDIKSFVYAPVQSDPDDKNAKTPTPVTWGISGTTTVTEDGKQVTKNVTQICDATIYTAAAKAVNANTAKTDETPLWKADTFETKTDGFVKISNCTHAISGTIYGYFTISEGKNKYTNYQAQIPYSFTATP